MKSDLPVKQGQRANASLDNRLLIDQWQDQAATYSAEVSLTQGYHRVRLEYYEGGGSAAVRLGWERVQ